MNEVQEIISKHSLCLQREVIKYVVSRGGVRNLAHIPRLIYDFLNSIKDTFFFFFGFNFIIEKSKLEELINRCSDKGKEAYLIWAAEREREQHSLNSFIDAVIFSGDSVYDREATACIQTVTMYLKLRNQGAPQ